MAFSVGGRASERTSDCPPHGAVYVATNDPGGNSIVEFSRDEDGGLRKAGTFSTEGKGTGGQLDPLASQGSLKLTADAHWLLAVNAGSDEISVFRVKDKGIELVDKAASLGRMPVSLAIRGDKVYVLNAGESPNVAGFHLSARGKLEPISGSVREFEGIAANALAQVGFSADGKKLVVTDKPDNSILSFHVEHDGALSASPKVSPSSGATPFGFLFDPRNRLLVSEAGANAVSSYEFTPKGKLAVISPSVKNGQMATCWIARTSGGHVFTTNPMSGTLSSYLEDDSDGSLSLLQGAAAEAKNPLDLAIVGDRFLYAIDPGNGGVDVYTIGRDGSLMDCGAAPGGLAIYAQGLAAR